VSRASAINARPRLPRACPSTERDRVHLRGYSKIPQKMTLPGEGPSSLAREEGQGEMQGTRSSARRRTSERRVSRSAAVARGRGARGPLGFVVARGCSVLPSSRPPHGTRNARSRLFYLARANNGPGNALGVSATLRALFAPRTADLYPTKIDTVVAGARRATRFATSVC